MFAYHYHELMHECMMHAPQIKPQNLIRNNMIRGHPGPSRASFTIYRVITYHSFIFPRWPAPLVTEVQQYDALNYYPAEAYHQNYYAQNPSQGYCQSVVAPKVAKIRAKFMKMLLS